MWGYSKKNLRHFSSNLSNQLNYCPILQRFKYCMYDDKNEPFVGQSQFKVNHKKSKLQY